MGKPRDDDEPHERNRGEFTETRWSLVLAAGSQSSPQATAALEILCRTYWYPIYSHVRRRGYAAPDAQDLTQEFLARLLRNHSFARVDRAKGKFRTYLLAAVNHFLADEWDKTRTQKRGGGETLLSLDEDGFERKYGQEMALDLSPEKLYDQQWATILLEQGIKRLREEFTAAGKAFKFELLKPFLTQEAAPGMYDTLAGKLQLSVSSIAVAVHRLRQRYRELVRAELAQTVSSPAEVDEELRHLFLH